LSLSRPPSRRRRPRRRKRFKLVLKSGQQRVEHRAWSSKARA
jgi:hypothetical protein